MMPDAVNYRKQFNPDLFRFDSAAHYAWRVFERVTIATITFNRLEHTKRLIESLLRHTHLPFELLVLDNASEDGTQAWLRDQSVRLPNLRIIENSKNVGRVRGLLRLRNHLEDGLLVVLDNDLEVLSNYWLVHVQKAFHAARLSQGGSTDVALGLNLINCAEYGFRFATRREVWRIPSGQNSLPRSSYAAFTKDDPDHDHVLDEEVVVGWTDHLNGGIMAMPVSLFRRIRLEDAYPQLIGGDDSFISDELRRLGVPFGYIENGPVLRHNDWPYSEAKIAHYEHLQRSRAPADRWYLLWKFRAITARLRGARLGNASR
jgi:GT2 family glycosyltransferase